MNHSNIIGESVPRVDARGKVTGRTKYAADMRLQGMLFGKIVFSPHPRARVLAIDCRAAQSMPGVRKIITALDLPGGNRYGYFEAHRPLLLQVGEETRHIGDSVAMVVATSEVLACQAAAAIVVEYQLLAPLTSPRQAMEPGAYSVHAEAERNCAVRREFDLGDVSAGFQTADVVVEQTYFTPRQEQAFLETEAGVAYQDDLGVLHLHSCLQDPYGVAEDIHLALEIPKTRIHVKGTPVGGGFGGKLSTTIQVHLAAMTCIAEAPVMLVLEREESFLFHAKRHPMEIRLKLGAGRDGTIHALEGEVIADMGPYLGRSAEVIGLTMSALTGPYRIPNIRSRAAGIYTNNLDSGAYRGFGGPQAAIARECVMDKLARALAMDPLELRRKNFLQSGEPPASPMLLKGPVSLELLTERVAEKLGPRPSAPKNSTIRNGRAICFDMPVYDIGAIPVLGKSGVGAAVEVHDDGGVTVFAGGTELGQGISTVLAQMAAEQFGLAMDSIRVEMTDTWTCPRAGRTSASRLTYGLGNALLLATGQLRETLLARAAQMLDIPTEDLIFEEGAIVPKGVSNQKLTFAKVARECSDLGDNLREEGWFRSAETSYKYGHTFMAVGADISVDIATGEFEILNLVNVLDMGKVLNPSMALGQLYGGAVQALGYGLMEDMVVEDGLLKTPSFAEYMIPTAMDLPNEFIAEGIEIPDPTGPYGAKGIGEAALNCTTPAVLNAISDAIGVEVNTVPVGQQHILAAVFHNAKEP